MDDSIRNYLMNIEAAPPATIPKLEEYTKISLSKVSSLGLGFSVFQEALGMLTTQAPDSQTFPLYRAVTANGTPMRLPNMISDGLGYATGYHTRDGLSVARMQEVSSVAQTSPMICNPTMLFMSMALVSIEKNLDEIQETQRQILMFMEEDKRSKLQGNFRFLSDVINNYKYNLESDTYRTNMHIKVQDIKQEAEQNIIFYQTKINKSLERRGFLVIDQNINDKMDKFQSDFEDLRFAIYSFGFSSFLEVMLLENFNSEYLNAITQRIKDYEYAYRELYTSCYNHMENALKSSIQTKTLSGLGKVSSLVGNAVNKIPKINETKIDGFFIDSGAKLENISQNRPEQTMKKFVRNKDCFVHTFIENINTVNELYNNPVDCLFDSENLYVKALNE